MQPVAQVAAYDIATPPEPLMSFTATNPPTATKPTPAAVIT